MTTVGRIDYRDAKAHLSQDRGLIDRWRIAPQRRPHDETDINTHTTDPSEDAQQNFVLWSREMASARQREPGVERELSQAPTCAEEVTGMVQGEKWANQIIEYCQTVSVNQIGKPPVRNLVGQTQQQVGGPGLVAVVLHPLEHRERNQRGLVRTIETYDLKTRLPEEAEVLARVQQTVVAIIVHKVLLK